MLFQHVQTLRKVVAKLRKICCFHQKSLKNKPFQLKTANSSQLCDEFVQGLDVLKEHSRAFQKLQNVVRLSKKVLKLYEQYFLYFFKIENQPTTQHSSNRPSTFGADCKVKIPKLSDSAEIENTKPPDPPESKNAQFVNFGP